MKYYILPVSLILIILFVLFGVNINPSSAKIELNTKIQTKIFDKYDSEFLFLFFGYVGCTDICTPRLKELSDIYMSINDKVDIDTVFVNLTELEDPELPQLFASLFNKQFNGVYLVKDELNKVKSEFTIYSASSFTSNGELEHTSLLFLLQKKDDGYYLKRIYTHIPFNKKAIVEDIMENLND